MPRLVFVISGNKVQNMGYRLFILNAMREHDIVGYPTNLGDGKNVRVQVWAPENNLKNFYDYLANEKPKGVGNVYLGHGSIDRVRMPESSQIMHEKLDLIVEQTGKFVEEGKRIRNSLVKLNSTLSRVDKNIEKLPEEIGKQIR